MIALVLPLERGFYFYFPVAGLFLELSEAVVEVSVHVNLFSLF